MPVENVLQMKKNDKTRPLAMGEEYENSWKYIYFFFTRDTG